MAMQNRSNSDPSGRLLLIDRDDVQAQAVAHALAQCLDRTASITVASGGKAAAELLRDSVFDIILADLSSLGDLAGHSDDAVLRLVRLAQGADRRAGPTAWQVPIAGDRGAQHNRPKRFCRLYRRLQRYAVCL